MRFKVLSMFAAVLMLSAVSEVVDTKPAAAQVSCVGTAFTPGLEITSDYLAQNCDVTRGNVQVKTSAGSTTLLSGTLTTASTVNSAQFVNYSGKGVKCTYNHTNESGAPSVTLAIQGYDAASASYQTLASNTTAFNNLASATTMPATLYAYPGIQTSSLPTGVVTGSTSLVVPRLWRVQVVISGTSSPAVTYTVGCDQLT